MAETSERAASEAAKARHAAIVAAAAGVFLRYGFKKTSMDDLARAAGLSRQGLYLHFPTKETLFKEAVLQLIATTRATSRAALADEADLGGEHCYKQVFILGTLKVPAFADNDTTGKLVLKADTITVGPLGLVTADAAGYIGGATSAANGGIEGGGPGKGCGGGPGSCVGQGGTGGSYGGVGAKPNNQWGNGNPCATCSQAVGAHCSGAASPAQGTDNGDEIALGSGGGAAGNSCGCTDAGGPGGRGGGSISLLANDWVNIEGIVSALGEEPPPDDSQCGYRPGGGGGSGGGIVVAADIVMGPDAATLRASGGRGGEALGNVGDQTWGWSGGGGGGGRVKVYAPDNQWTGKTDVTGGLGGKFPATGQSFGGDPGAAGTTFVSDKLPAVYDNLSCK